MEITTAEASALLGKSESTIRTWVKDGKLSPVGRANGTRGHLFRREDVERMVYYDLQTGDTILEALDHRYFLSGEAYKTLKDWEQKTVMFVALSSWRFKDWRFAKFDHTDCLFSVSRPTVYYEFHPAFYPQKVSGIEIHLEEWTNKKPALVNLHQLGAAGMVGSDTEHQYYLITSDLIHTIYVESLFLNHALKYHTTGYVVVVDDHAFEGIYCPVKDGGMHG